MAVYILITRGRALLAENMPFFLKEKRYQPSRTKSTAVIINLTEWQKIISLRTTLDCTAPETLLIEVIILNSCHRIQII